VVSAILYFCPPPRCNMPIAICPVLRDQAARSRRSCPFPSPLPSDCQSSVEAKKCRRGDGRLRIHSAIPAPPHSGSSGSFLFRAFRGGRPRGMAGGSAAGGAVDSTSAIKSAIVVCSAAASLWITTNVGIPCPRSISETCVRCRPASSANFSWARRFSSRRRRIASPKPLLKFCLIHGRVPGLGTENLHSTRLPT